jgi:hypothetical protein
LSKDSEECNYETDEELPCCGKKISFDGDLCQKIISSGLTTCPKCGKLIIWDDEAEEYGGDGFLRLADITDLDEDDLKTISEIANYALNDHPEIMCIKLKITNKKYKHLKTMLQKIL